LHYTYETGTGALSSVTAADGGTVAFSYDGLLKTSTAWTGAVAGSVSYTHDDNFRVTSQSVNGEQTINLDYDPDGVVTSVGDLTLTRDAQNGLLTGTAVGEVSDTLSYNGFAELTDYRATVNDLPIFHQAYTRDSLGRVTQTTETIDGATNAYDYTYDEAGRLTEVKLNGVVSATYTYDSNGNRLTRATPAGTITSTTDAQDHLLSDGTATYTYTANGEVASKSVGSQTTTYTVDVFGTLTAATLPDGTQIAYVLDGLQRRIGKTVNGTLVQGFLYQNQLNPVAELDSEGNLVSRFVYASKGNVPDYMVKGGITYRIISDHLGSPRLVVDVTSGAIVQRMDYDEFGQVITDTNPGFQPFGFAGGLYDQDTKLVHFGAREYEAETGRWTAKDPILFQGGDTNLYGYVLNDPVNLIDAFGTDAEKAYNWARAQVGSGDYSIISTHSEIRGTSGQYFGGAFSTKCSAFLNDALTAGGNPPGRGDDGVIPQAGEYSDPSVNVPGYYVLSPETPLRPGDIVAEGRHVGLYAPLLDGSPGTISAASTFSFSQPFGHVVHNDWGFRDGQNPTFRRELIPFLPVPAH